MTATEQVAVGRPKHRKSGPGRVVVVGGGLAGISAALACADAGADVTLLEARNRLGGAAFSFRRAGLSIDNGQHVFLRCCTAYRGLLERLGVSGDTHLQGRLSIPVVADGGAVCRLRRSSLPAPWHLAASLAAYRPLRPGDRWRAVRAARALRRVDRGAAAADDVSFGRWLRAHSQSAAAISDFWDLVTLPTLNLPADEASLALAAKVFQTGLLEQADAADLGYATAPLSALHHDAALRGLRRAGVGVHLGQAVGAVGADRSVLVAGRRLDADSVVVAVPPEQARALLPATALSGLPRVECLGASPIVNLHVVYDRAVSPHAFAAAVGSPVQWIFDRTDSSGLSPRDGQYLAVSLSAADDYIAWRSADLRTCFLPALARLFPRARDARIRRFFVTRERNATFRQAPGSQAFRPAPTTGAAGVYLAGAWTDTGWPATMEGAVRSGRSAARLALTQLAATAAKVVR